MPIQIESMPIATVYDPAADAAGSADPLGTLSGSERLAEVILPGLTARMWRARLLTFTVIAAEVADCVVRRRDDQEDLRLSARLAFERLFVSSLVRAENNDPARYSGVARRVPGSRTARRALLVDDEPLSRRTFIKGQAVNGPSGVMARLARHLTLISEDGQVANRGQDLRSVWALADEDCEDGGEFYRRVPKAHLLHRQIASYCGVGSCEFGVGVVTRLRGFTMPPPSEASAEARRHRLGRPCRRFPWFRYARRSSSPRYPSRLPGAGPDRG